MRYLFFAIFLLSACGGDHENISRQCFKMYISDGIPVQFWINGCQTFNQEIVEGINHVCFCQPFQCDDEIKLQITNPHADDPLISTPVTNSFSIDIVDPDSNVIVNIPFIRTQSTPDDIYSLSFTPSDHDICDQKVVFNIISDRNPTIDANGDVGDPNGQDWNYLFDQVASSNKSWTLSTTDATVILGGSDPVSSKYLISHFALFGIGPVTTLHIKGTVAQILGSDPVNINGAFKIFVEFVPSSGPSFVYEYLNDTADSTGLGDYDIVKEINTGLSQYITIKWRIERQSSVVDAIIAQMTIFSTREKNLAAYSDCINIATTQPETILINYSNNRNFAGIDNQDISPDTDFNLRIPAIFAQKRFPQEQEVGELSDNQEISLNSQIKVQKLLDICHMPDYMHQKTILALMNQVVTIKGQQWIKADDYEKIEGNKRSPMTRYRVWLTQKDYIVRNIL